MKTATVRQVRHEFGEVMDWVAEGESVEVSKRGKIIAVICPPTKKKTGQKKRPDFLGRLKKIYGDKPRKGGNPVVEERATHRF